MTVLVTDTGFAPDDWVFGYVPISAVSTEPTGDALGIDIARSELTRWEWDRLGRALPRCGLIRVALCDFGDQAAFRLARDLRAQGYRGRLRAHGAVAARFYTLLRRAGFDEIELDATQAHRQPREHWRNEYGWMPKRERTGDGTTPLSG